MIAETAGIFGERMFVAAPGHEQVDELGQGREDVHQPQSRDRATHVEIRQERIEQRNGFREVVPLPEGRPRDQDQEKACFEQ